ncbi:(2Fe-2S)-binding protein [Pseudomonas gingeri]|uniref:(2Fe-2S)-binding protein n=1 Tax=Pseudomonas gingeri TaxID=117681 RepID=A0A7Y7YCQ6_9PSED|nr:(2Fe-2S)-binding protein [Pseudomonas gingeri]NWA02356.1 (2Fe-2S)-binding protein [Pseudomonas gingeri]NWA12471.1 (2Fe-2S)-binding protein [Pseudomonas gingeri]NWA57123.1 (2Fe-2S)-binding protein [Pseudomonas gingeri]NWA93466.1 (2Fe-2S)-binding protein [Pseudomonas gingeri]NWB02938.1 (2Fe-2S)-binding protein [Pseudomonas gingeri]
MGAKALFRSIEPAGPRVTIEFNGRPLDVLADTTLAAALLDAGIRQSRQTPVSGAPRTTYCMMGVCFDCLVLIDGISRQACQVRTQPGLRVHSHCPVPVEGDADA